MLEVKAYRLRREECFFKVLSRQQKTKTPGRFPVLTEASVVTNNLRGDYKQIYRVPLLYRFDNMHK